MIGLFCFVVGVLASPFKSNLRLEAENAVLRYHQSIVLRRKLHGHVRLTNNDRWFFIQLCRWFQSVLQVLTIIQPETLVRWHGAGFRSYWRWRSRPVGGRPRIDTELSALIRQMSTENQLWGAPRIHGELLKLGFEVAQFSGTWSNGGDRPARDGGPSCIATRLTLPPRTCSLCWFRPALWHSHRPAIAETSSGSTSQQIRRPNGLHVRSPRHFLGMRLATTAIATGSMAASSRADCAPWASGTSRLHQPRLGRTALPNGGSDRSGVSVWTTSLSWARRICAESCDPMRTITAASERIDP